jgi:hypothetical protein
MYYKRFFEHSTLFLYTAIIFIFFVEYMDPFLENKSFLRWGADSLIYLNIAKFGADSSMEESSSFINTIGPVLIAKLLNNNNLAITVFNYLLFLLSVFLLSSIENVNKIRLRLLIIANPMMLVSIASISKEIIGFTIISIFLYLLYQETDKDKVLQKRWAAIIFIGSFLVRWQMAFIIGIFFLCKNVFTGSRFTKCRSFSILLLILFLSITYPIFRSAGLTGEAEAWSVTERGPSLGTIYILNDLQNNYMYFLSFIPKILMNLVLIDSTIPDRIAEGATEYGYIDVYNLYIVPFHTIMTVITLFIIVLKQRKLMLDKNSHYLYIIYSLIIALSPFIQPRYFFPAYAILCLEASLKNQVSSEKQEVASIPK